MDARRCSHHLKENKWNLFISGFRNVIEEQCVGRTDVVQHMILNKSCGNADCGTPYILHVKKSNKWGSECLWDEMDWRYYFSDLGGQLFTVAYLLKLFLLSFVENSSMFWGSNILIFFVIFFFKKAHFL